MIEVKNVHKRFEKIEALKGMSTEIRKEPSSDWWDPTERERVLFFVS